MAHPLDYAININRLQTNTQRKANGAVRKSIMLMPCVYLQHYASRTILFTKETWQRREYISDNN